MSEKQKCVQCQKEEAAFCHTCFENRGDCSLKRKNWKLLSRLVDKIYDVYPGATITGFFLGGKKCMIHFRVGCGGSDSVHVMSNGKIWQTISGDLDLNTLEMLQDELERIIDEQRRPIPNLSLTFK